MDFQRLKEILPKDPLVWTQEDVLKWLEFIGLEKYASEFTECTIDGSILCSLNEEDLKNDLKIANSIQRKKLMNWITVGIKSYSELLRKSPDNIGSNQLVLSELNQNNQQKIALDENGKMYNFQKKYPMNNFDDTDISNRLSFQNVAVEDKYLFEMNTSNIKQSFSNKFGGNNNNSLNGNNIFRGDNLPMRLPVCNGKLDSSSEEDKESQEEINAPLDQNKPEDAQQIEDPANCKNVLIIEPVEGVQTSFFCVKEEGGKIGRHSSNQILILEESISRYHAEILFHDKKFFLRDIGSSTGTFIKVKDRIELVMGLIIEMGSYQFEITEMDPSSQFIQLTILEDVRQGVQKQYNLEIGQSEEQSGFVSIGRKPSNKIQLPDDQHLSNVHAKIYFMNGGFFLEDNASTNGSWIRLSKESETSEEWEITNNTIIKIGSTSSYNCRFEKTIEKDFVPDSCLICSSQDKDAVFLPCRHNGTCIKCSKTLQTCPICRTKIEDIVKIFKA